MEQAFGPSDDDDFVESDLRRYAPRLNARWWRWPLLDPTYRLLADALYWMDEAPPWGGLRRAENALRLLWHYRTGLILGEPRPFAEYWELGKRLFPRWVGFYPARCRPLRHYKILYRAGRIASSKCLAELEREIEKIEP
jgi:hypothetical protein